MIWLLASLTTGLPLGVAWFAYGRLPAPRPLGGVMGLEDDGSDWRRR